MAKLDGKIAVILVVLVIAGFFFFRPKSNYNVLGGMDRGQPVAEYSGQGNLSTSLLPKEIPSQEDFGKFSPEAIMKNQNYLDPRSQIGYPGTVGGVIRNANYDVRSEPQNARTPVSIWNNSTIVPDEMRPQFEIGR
jgi:hypothetical protein